MFGQDGSESPRVPSPWDSLSPSPPLKATSLDGPFHLRNGIPKLTAEVEEGNVEYKLKLTDISHARFARLVTQLKWRLLEGGGQAYYELGVADSGALIGLSHADLEESLQTLDNMAAEIGASVIVVKEIEIPPAMAALADKISAYIDPETGMWTDKMSNRRHKAAHAVGSLDDADVDADTTTDYSDDDDDDESSAISTPYEPPESGSRASSLLPTYVQRFATSNPNRPTAQSSPSIFAFDEDLALFSTEPEPSMDRDDPAAADVEVVHFNDIPEFALDVGIVHCYKLRPRPARPRSNYTMNAARAAQRVAKNKPKAKDHTRFNQTVHTDTSLDVTNSVGAPNKESTKALHRRWARDKRREQKRMALAAESVTSQSAESTKEGDVLQLTTGMEGLHVAVQCADAVVVTEKRPVDDLPHSVRVPSLSDEVKAPKSLADCKEPRLIVEALVVRKMSVDEGFLNLDLVGFG